MKLVALETAGSRLGVCLWEDFRVKAFKVEGDAHSHSHRLMPAMHGLFEKAGWSPQDLDGVAVNAGPGRFTGLRIGVSAARTLGQTLDKPVAEVSSLEALAAQASGWQVGKSFSWKFPHDLLCVLADAGRDDVYMAVWRFHKLSDRGRRAPGAGRSYHTFGHHFKLVHSPTFFIFHRFLTFFQSCFQAQTLLFAGSGAMRHKKALQDAFGTRARFATGLLEPDARWVAALGAEKFFRREVKAYGQVLPVYLRPSYAEENAKKNGL